MHQFLHFNGHFKSFPHPFKEEARDITVESPLHGDTQTILPLQVEYCEHQAIIHAADSSETSYQASDSVFQDMSSIPPLEKSNEIIDDESWGDTDSMIDDGSSDALVNHFESDSFGS